MSLSPLSASPSFPSKIDCFTVRHLIGTGSFATVWLGEHSPSKIRVAIKSVSVSSFEDADMRTRFVREVTLMKQMDHPFIGKLYQVIETADAVHLIQEYVENGTLLSYVNQHERLPELHARRLFSQLLAAIEYIHEEKMVVHRDIKAENVLLDAHWNLRLIDFGLSHAFTITNPTPLPPDSPPSSDVLPSPDLPVGHISFAPSRIRKTISDRSMLGKSVFLVRNAYPRTKPRVYRLVTLEDLSVDAIRVCQLNDKATKVFKSDGTIITSVEDVDDQETLYVSAGEPFGHGVFGGPKSRRPPPSNRAPISHAPKTQELPDSPTRSPKTKHERLHAEILSFHRIVALSHRSVDESLKESTASVFASLDPTQQSALEGVSKIHDDCQIQLFHSHLLRLGIGPSGPEVLPETIAFAQNAFQKLAIGDVQFVIGGPRQSGKTTLLYLLSSVLCRKLQVSTASSQYLLFPLNCELAVLDFTDPIRLMRLFLRITFESLEYSSLKFLPYVDELRKWFTVCVFGSAVAFPKELAQANLLNVDGLVSLARDLKARVQEDRDARSQSEDSLQLFMRAVCAFPGGFARALGLRGAVFFIDGFEYSGVPIEPGPRSFPRSLSAVRLSDVLSRELARSPYLVSMKAEQPFFETFAVAGAAFVSTEGLIPFDHDQDHEIEVRDVTLPSGEGPNGVRIAVSHCRGYPGFVSRFYRIAELLESQKERAANPSAFAVIRTAADVSRFRAIRFEVVAFTDLLAKAGLLEEVSAAPVVIGTPQNLTARFVAKKATKKTGRVSLWTQEETDLANANVLASHSGRLTA